MPPRPSRISAKKREKKALPRRKRDLLQTFVCNAAAEVHDVGADPLSTAWFAYYVDFKFARRRRVGQRAKNFCRITGNGGDLFAEMTSDLVLRREFAGENSQDAFADIVRRYLDLVYSATLRQVRASEARVGDSAITLGAS